MTAMGPLDLLNHVLNFVAPAAAVGLLLALLAPLLLGKPSAKHSLLTQSTLNFVAGLVALVCGMLFFGRDGKMASYAGMVLVCACSQWWAMRR